MADPGVAPTPPVPEGLQVMNQFSQEDGNPTRALAFKTQLTQTLAAKGWGQGAIDEYFGDDKIADPTVVAQVKQNIQRNAVAVQGKIASNPFEAFSAGWQSSDTGMILSRKLPNISAGPNAGFINTLAQASGQFFGDAPFSVAGGVAGGAAGAAIPVADATGIPEVAGAGAGAMGVPTLMRHALIMGIKSGNYTSSSELMKDAWDGTIDTLKDATIGAITGPLGKFGAGKAAGALGDAAATTGGRFLVGATDVATQVTAATGAQAAMSGRMPNANDFASAAVLALGTHAGLHFTGGSAVPNEAAKRVQSNLQAIYEQTGIAPWDAVKIARTNPELQQELLTQDVHGDPTTPVYKTAAPPEPPRYGDPETGTPAWAERRRAIAVSTVPRLLDLTEKLEGSTDDAVSPAGAIGRHQIMPGTARQYGYKPEDMFDPRLNREAAAKIVGDLSQRFHGDEAAVLVGYNAGPGWAAKFEHAGPGTRLEATLDKTVAGGVRYDRVQAERNEAFLPLETQKYLANGRRRAGSDLQGSPTAPSHPEAGLDTLAAAEGTQAPEKGLGGSPEWEQVRQKALDQERGETQKAADEAQAEWEKTNAEAKEQGLAPPKPLGDENDWLARVGDQIADPRPPEKLTNPDRLYRQYLDDRGPARAIDAHLSTFGLNPRKDVGLTDMLTYARAADGRAAAMLKWGAFDKDGNPLGGPSFSSAFDLAKKAGGNRDDWERYILAQRAMHLESARGVESGLSMPEVQAITESLSLKAKYQPATDEWNRFTNDTFLPYMRDAGLYSDEQVQAMKEQNPTYIAMQRAIENPQQRGVARGFSVTQMSKIKGSDAQIVSPMESTMWNVARGVANADRNRALGYLVDLGRKGMLPDEVGFKEIGAEKDTPEDLLNPDRESATAGLKPTQVRFFEDGKPKVFEVNDPEFATLLRGVSTAGEANIIDRTMSTFAKISRSGIAGMIDFPLRVVGFHQIQNFVTSPDHPLPYVTWMRGALDAVTGNDAYKKAQFNGAFGAAMSDMDLSTLHDDMAKVFQDTGVNNTLMNVVPNVVHLSSIIHSRIDAAARLGNIKVLEGNGIGAMKASLRTRQELLDFTQRGSDQFVNQMARWTPFLKGRLIGTENWVRAFKERPIETMTMGTLAMTLPAVGLGILAQIQDATLPPERRLDQYDPRLRDTHLITPEIGGQRFMVPMPPVLGNLFLGPTWRMLDKMKGDDPEGFDKWGSRMIADMLDVIPPAVKPILEQATNHSFFTGKPLVPGTVADRSPSQQFTSSTTPTAKALSSILSDNTPLHVSPIVIDNYAQQWGGTMGQMAMKALGAPFQDPGRPTELGDIPFIKSFVALHPHENAESVQHFYDQEKEFEQKHADFAGMMKEKLEGIPSAPSFEAMRPTMLAGNEYEALANVNKMLKVQQFILQRTYVNKDMTPEEKMQRITSIYRQMIQYSQYGSTMIQHFHQANANALTPGAEAPDGATSEQP